MEMMFVLVLIVLLSVTHTSQADDHTASKDSQRPNMLFILADDLNLDLLEKTRSRMPHLTKYFGPNTGGGVEFLNHVAAAPVCGPSRSSLLAGRYPHNVGYVANAAADSIAAFRKVENHTIGTWLTKVGYYTAFLGKYVNGMECDVPSGWRHWGGLTCTAMKPGGHSPFSGHTVLGGTYNYYNSSQWEADWDKEGNLVAPPTVNIHTGRHQRDFLSNQTLMHAKRAVDEGSPFFIHVTPLMVHYGTCYGPQPLQDFAFDDPWFEKMLPYNRSIPISPCPSVDRKHASDGMVAPHYESWNKTESGTIPEFISQRAGLNTSDECCNGFEAYRQNIGFRNRSSALLDLDDLFGSVLGGLDDMGVLDNTIVVFSSDNGYHLGEHKLLFGKSEPYETDIRLPMFWRGPGFSPGVRSHPTNHMDITATLADIGKTGPGGGLVLDGESLMRLAGSNIPMTSWRNFSFSEFYVMENTWWGVRLIDSSTGLASQTFHWWCSNQAELFDMASDPQQLVNKAGSLEDPVVADWIKFLIPLGNCSGTDCVNPTRATTVGTTPLPCHQTGVFLDVDETWIDPAYPH